MPESDAIFKNASLHDQIMPYQPRLHVTSTQAQVATDLASDMCPTDICTKPRHTPPLPTARTLSGCESSCACKHDDDVSSVVTIAARLTQDCNRDSRPDILITF
jgi:hypothetical protein